MDSPLKKLDRYEGAPADRIRGASRRALQNMTRLAIQEQVDLVVVAGDLYDGDWTDQNTGLAFVKEAAKLVAANIPVLVIRGNHDAANQMTSSLPLPKNPDGTEIFLPTGQPDSRFFDDLGIVVHGQSFRSRAEKANLASKYPDPISGICNIGLLHTGLEGGTSHAHYAPCTRQELTDKGYDYWALGHIHQHADHGIDGGAPIVFSGNIQGRHIAEQGPKGCVIIDVDSKHHCRHQFHTLDVLRWHECVIDARTMKDRDEVTDAFETWVSEAIETCDSRLLVVRVRLTGPSALHSVLHQNSEWIRADLQAVCVATGGDQVWLEDLKIRTSPLEHQRRDVELEGPLESLSHVLKSLRHDPMLADAIEDELKGLAKKLPKELKGQGELSAFPLGDDEWIGGLLESAAADVLGRLQSDNAASESAGAPE